MWRPYPFCTPRPCCWGCCERIPCNRRVPVVVVVVPVDPGSALTLARLSCSFSFASCGWTSLVSTRITQSTSTKCQLLFHRYRRAGFSRFTFATKAKGSPSKIYDSLSQRSQVDTRRTSKFSVTRLSTVSISWKLVSKISKCLATRASVRSLYAFLSRSITIPVKTDYTIRRWERLDRFLTVAPREG